MKTLLWFSGGLFTTLFGSHQSQHWCIQLWGLGSLVTLTGPWVHQQRKGLDAPTDCSNNSRQYAEADSDCATGYNTTAEYRVGSCYLPFSLAQELNTFNSVLSLVADPTCGVGSKENKPLAIASGASFPLCLLHHTGPTDQFSRQAALICGVGSHTLFSLALDFIGFYSQLYSTVVLQTDQGTGVGSLTNFSLALSICLGTSLDPRNLHWSGVGSQQHFSLALADRVNFSFILPYLKNALISSPIAALTFAALFTGKLGDLQAEFYCTGLFLFSSSSLNCVGGLFPIFFAPAEVSLIAKDKRHPIFFAPAEVSLANTDTPVLDCTASETLRDLKLEAHCNNLILKFFTCADSHFPIFFDPANDCGADKRFTGLVCLAQVGTLILVVLCCTRLSQFVSPKAAGTPSFGLSSIKKGAPEVRSENNRTSCKHTCVSVPCLLSSKDTQLANGLYCGPPIWLSAQNLFSNFWCKPGPNSRGRSAAITARTCSRFVLSFCCLILILATTIGSTRSEGCILVMEDAEVSHTHVHTPGSHVDAKPHDTRPETCGHAKRWLPATRQIVKRSLKRAYARSLQHGISWYRGRSYTPHDFPRALRDSYQPPPQKPPGMSKPLITCNELHTDKQRFRVLNWNAGGIGAFRVDELKVWMLNQCIEVAFITETRWCFENTWMDENFHFIHTGDPSHKGMGILCILAKHFCPANCLRWRPVVPGRLLHVQVQHASRCVDLVGCYQHTSVATRQCQQHREQLWAQLDSFLHGLVQRNILVLAGDFNCDLLQSTSHSGPDQFYWNRTLTRGATHADNGRFTTILRDHGLTALNSWQPHLGPTFVHADTCSRIDFIITRKHVADGAAKQVTYAWDAPFQGPTGHVPMVANLRKQWFQTKRAQNE